MLLCIIWTGKARSLNMCESQCGQICLDIYNFVNMPEYAWNITCVNKPEFWIFVNQVRFRMRMKYFWVVSEAKSVNGSEYAWISHGFWICFNIHECLTCFNCASILNIPQPVKIYPNVGKYPSICLMLGIWLNMPEI